eukprot:921401-Lingulodinium_polyedra.AAC.1
MTKRRGGSSSESGLTFAASTGSARCSSHRPGARLTASLQAVARGSWALACAWLVVTSYFTSAPRGRSPSCMSPHQLLASLSSLSFRRRKRPRRH